jgi:hypothetical protein
MAIIVCPHCGTDIEAIEEKVTRPLAIFRGGGWAQRDPRRSAFRFSDHDLLADNDLGFRPVLPPTNHTRILRGNSFITGSRCSRSTNRIGARETYNLVITTFRPALPQ